MPPPIDIRDEALTALFAERGFALAETPILQPASLFLELSGEDIRRRLYLTQDADGREWCLRPEYTIPVCRQHVERNLSVGRYSYIGPVFRQRPGEAGEFRQAGFESIGRTDVDEADADAVALAMDCIALYEGAFEVRMGDMGLFEAVMEALGIPRRAQRRITLALAAGRGIDAALKPEARPGRSEYAGLLAAIEGQDASAARAFVEDVISIAGIASVGGRSPAEIADRFLSKASNRSEAVSEEARDTLRRYLAIQGAPEKAAADLRTLAQADGLAIEGALDRLARRNALMAAQQTSSGISVTFATDFVRNLDYYTGFVFEIVDPVRGDPRLVAGGGRYDRLLGQLGAAAPLPAVGCSFWLDRLVGRRA
jgi:ATP phosphoribosyltransferase regulatory subunit